MKKHVGPKHALMNLSRFIKIDVSCAYWKLILNNIEHTWYIVWTYLKIDVDVQKPRRSYFLAAILRQRRKKNKWAVVPFLSEESFRGWKLICNLYCLDKQPLKFGWMSTFHLDMGMDQYLLISFLGEWTSIYQLFWCSPGVQGFDTLPYDDIAWACGKEYLGKHRIEVPRPKTAAVCFCWCSPMIQWICFRQKMQETVVFTHIYP